MAVTFPLLKGVFESLFNCHGNLTFCVGGDLKKRKGNGGIMRHDVASATQAVKSEKKGGGGRRNLV